MAIRPPLHENQLLLRVANGDEHAFAELFRWYAGPLGEFVLKITDTIELAEEVVQDCFIKIWLRRDTLTTVQNFSGYLFIICRNQAFLALKKLAVRKVFQDELEKHLLEEADEQEIEDNIETYRSMIEEAVAKLPPQQQKAYMLSRYQRLKHEEIAKELGLSSETVKKHIQLALHFIKKDVGGRINPALAVIMTSAFMHLR